MTADVRVVVVTYNSEGFLGPFLDSVAESSQREIAITVSDNGSRDSSLAIAEGRPGVTVLRNGANLGYGSAANRGAAGAAEEWLVIANPDVRLTPDCLDTLLEAAERWPTAGVLGPGILTPEGELYPSARLLPSLRRGVGHATLGWVWPSNPWSTAYRNDRGEPREGVVGWLSGSFMVVHRAAFEAVGGFDEGFFMYFEDVDLCDRLGRQGWTSVYVPQAKVLHVGGHSTTKDPASADLWHAPTTAVPTAISPVGMPGPRGLPCAGRSGPGSPFATACRGWWRPWLTPRCRRGASGRLESMEGPDHGRRRIARTAHTPGSPGHLRLRGCRGRRRLHRRHAWPRSHDASRR